MGENVQKTRYAYIRVLRAIAMLLVGRVSTGVGIDEGYIVSALYAVILFYVFWKMKDRIANNRVTAYFDSIGLSFFLLHNCIGWLLMQGMYYIVLHETHVWIAMLTAVAGDMLIITAYSQLIQRPMGRLLRLPLKKRLS